MKNIFFSLFTFCLLQVNAQSTQLAPVKVKVSSMENKPYAGDKVFFISQKSKKQFFGVTDTKGIFQISLPSDDIYDIKLLSIGEEIDYNTFEIPKLGAGETFNLSELEIQYDPGKNFTLNNLQFDTGKASLKAESHSQLADLIEVMKLKPTMRIEIQGHTDSDGDETANQTLSQNRSESVKTYLVSKGIAANRIQCKGFGENRPVADNNSAAGRAQNRRTEIIVL